MKEADMRRQTFLWALLLAAIASAPPVFAQSTSTATIRGTVTDESQAVVQGAKVTLKGQDTGFTQLSTTNSARNYSFPDIPVGMYQVTIEKPGFKMMAKKNIVLNVADTRAVDLSLSAGEVTETLT